MYETKNRQGQHPQSHLAQFSGVLQADAFAGYNEVYSDGHVGRPRAWPMRGARSMTCMHAGQRRRQPKRCAGSVELYAVEVHIRGQPPDRRREIRQQQARPLLDSLESWLRERLLTLSTQSDTTKAINYMIN